MQLQCTHLSSEAQRAQGLVGRVLLWRQGHEHECFACAGEARLQDVRKLGVAVGDVLALGLESRENVGQAAERLVDGLRLLEPVPFRVRPVGRDRVYCASGDERLALGTQAFFCLYARAQVRCGGQRQSGEPIAADALGAIS